MKLRRALCALAVCGWLASPLLAGGEIHGVVHTTSGDRLSGPIRWDGNENFWDDVLDTAKIAPKEEDERGFKLSIFGWELFDSAESVRIVGTLSIPFGHIASIESLPDDRARLVLKGGHTIEVTASSDIGPRMSGLIVDDAQRGRQELKWRKIDRIEFSHNPAPGRDAERLYGTVQTGDAGFTGFIVWDLDESLAEDVLDGEDADGDHEIPFGNIRELVPDGLSRTRVVLADGSELVLEGTNDVDSSNRGLLVTLPGVGTAEIPYDEVVRVTFAEPPASPLYRLFDGGQPLGGTVRLKNGKTLSGAIVWDRDEAFSWEALDGDVDEIDYSVRLSNIKSVKPVSRRASELVLRNGDRLVLSDSNDVDDDNRGLIVTTRTGDVVEVDWATVAAVEFD